MLKDFTKEKFDILIIAGQSNSEGTGFGPVDVPYEPNEQIWYLNGDFTISNAVEFVQGNAIKSMFGLSFAREYLEKGLLQEGRKILILRCAVGATGFLDNRWKHTDDLYLRMIEMIQTALSLNEENRLVALLWHQGETDARLNISYEVYYHHLMTLVRSVDERFAMPDLPFIAADFVPKWKQMNMEIATPVSDAIRAVCRDYEHGVFVETEGLQSNAEAMVPGRPDDMIHFSRRSLYELGERYFAAYQKVMNQV